MLATGRIGVTGNVWSAVRATCPPPLASVEPSSRLQEGKTTNEDNNNNDNSNNKPESETLIRQIVVCTTNRVPAGRPYRGLHGQRPWRLLRRPWLPPFTLWPAEWAGPAGRGGAWRAGRGAEPAAEGGAEGWEGVDGRLGGARLGLSSSRAAFPAHIPRRREPWRPTLCASGGSSQRRSRGRWGKRGAARRAARSPRAPRSARGLWRGRGAVRGGPGGRGRGLRAGTGLAPGAGGVGRAARRWPCWLSRVSRGSRRCGRRRTPGSVPGLVSPGGVETACPGDAHGGGKAGDGLVPPTFGGWGASSPVQPSGTC